MANAAAVIPPVIVSGLQPVRRVARLPGAAMGGCCRRAEVAEVIVLLAGETTRIASADPIGLDVLALECPRGGV